MLFLTCLAIARAATPAARATTATPATAPLLPPWPSTWAMHASTIVMPCNYSGYFDADYAAQFAVVDFDWSNAKQLWANTKPMDCQERLVTQAQMVKAKNPRVRTFVYRNIVKALPWYTQVREKLEDPNYAGWFLRFRDYPAANASYHVPACTAGQCSQFYHDQSQTPEHPHGDGSCVDACDCGSVPCGEYLWDHRNASLRAWLVDEFIGGKQGIQNAAIDGFFLDDGWHVGQDKYAPWMPKAGFCDTCAPGSPADKCPGGPTEEDVHCVVDMGLSAQDVKDITAAWKLTMSAAQAAIVKGGGFNWQLFSGATGPTTGMPAAQCAAVVRDLCSDTKYNEPLVFDFATPVPDFNLDLATFLLVRGPYAWLGYSWDGCVGSVGPGPGASMPYVKYGLPKTVQADYGEPTSRCEETAAGSGVFTRAWSKATVTVDCNDGVSATIDMK